MSSFALSLTMNDNVVSVILFRGGDGGGGGGRVHPVQGVYPNQVALPPPHPSLLARSDLGGQGMVLSRSCQGRGGGRVPNQVTLFPSSPPNQVTLSPPLPSPLLPPPPARMYSLIVSSFCTSKLVRGFQVWI